MSTHNLKVSGGELILKEVCQILKKTNAIEFGTFKLPNGRVTPYYINLRVIPSFPDAFTKILDIFVNAIKNDVGTENFDRVAGIPTAGMSLSAVIAYNFRKPFFYIRQKTKLKGRERRVEGIVMPGDRVLLVDDLVTTGISLERSASAARAEGGVVSDAFVLLDREEGGKERLSRIGVNLHSVLSMSQVAKELYEMNFISEEDLKIILSQIKTKKR